MMGMAALLLRRYATPGRGCEETATEEFKAMAADAKELKEVAFSYVFAKNWRKAALAFGEEAACALKLGDELTAASALLRSAQCYNKLEDRDGEEVAATRIALEKAFELFNKAGERLMAATSCLELAEFSMDQHRLGTASDWFEQAAEYYSSTRQRRYCMDQAKGLRLLMANLEMCRNSKESVWLRFVKGDEETLIQSSIPDYNVPEKKRLSARVPLDSQYDPTLFGIV